MKLCSSDVPRNFRLLVQSPAGNINTENIANEGQAKVRGEGVECDQGVALKIYEFVLPRHLNLSIHFS